MDLALPVDFLSQHWRRRPAAVSGAFDTESRSCDWIRRFREWCCPPVTPRLFIRDERRGPGTARAFDVTDHASALELFDAYAGHEALTILLNGVEHVAPEMERIRARFGVQLPWREDDIVATLSTPGSGIGYHAGHEDGFIVQLAGSRIWRVWHPDHLPDAYQLSVVGWSGATVPTPPRPEAPPVGEYELHPGDVLYIPPFFGHDGLTRELSVSLSVAWRGLTPFEVLRRGGEVSATIDFTATGERLRLLFSLLPDPPVGCNDVCGFLCSEVWQRAGWVGGDITAAHVTSCVEAFLRVRTRAASRGVCGGACAVV